MKSVAFGIDLGTTRSVIAHLDSAGRPSTIQNLEGDLTTPSAVFFDQSSIVVGKEALKVAEYEPDRVAQFAKRELGKKDVMVKVAGRQFPPEVIQALVLRKMKSDAEHRLGTLEKCVVTVPAYFNEPRRKATQDSGRMAGLNVVDIINEPTAAALAYGVQQGFLNPEGRSESLESVLVYDLGGGTFDVTLMDIQGNDYKAIATAGDVYLGGVDWDRRLVDHVSEQFMIQFGVDPRTDPTNRQRLTTEAEDAKRALTQREEVTIRFSIDDHRIQVPVNRHDFESMCGDLIDRTLLTTRRVLKEAGRDWSAVSRLLLVGGSSRMPMVENMLESESGLTVDRSISADESVAHGAAIYAGILRDSDSRIGSSSNRISVSNVNSHDLGILGLDKKTGSNRRSIMIARNSSLPIRKAKRFATSKDNQKSVAVKVVEGGDDEGNYSTRIGNCVVSGLPPNLPAKTHVDVIFHYQDDGRLQVVAQLPSINKRAELVIQRESGLKGEDCQLWQTRIEDGTLLEVEPTEEPEETTVDQSTVPDLASPAFVEPQASQPIEPPVIEPQDADIGGMPDFSGITAAVADSTIGPGPVFEEPLVVPIINTQAPAPVSTPIQVEPQTEHADSPAPIASKKKSGGGWKSRRKQVTPGDAE